MWFTAMAMVSVFFVSKGLLKNSNSSSLFSIIILLYSSTDTQHTFSCYLSCELLGVNPFDQPGVEAYKHQMFALLGKP